jgi:hypothetical protein
MSNSMSDDYFSFMARKGAGAKTADRGAANVKRPVKAAPAPAAAADIIDFVDDSQMEVTESVASDTLIQRMFKRCGNA